MNCRTLFLLFALLLLLPACKYDDRPSANLQQTVIGLELGSGIPELTITIPIATAKEPIRIEPAVLQPYYDRKAYFGVGFFNKDDLFNVSFAITNCTPNDKNTITNPNNLQFIPYFGPSSATSYAKNNVTELAGMVNVENVTPGIYNCLMVIAHESKRFTINITPRIASTTYKN